MLPWNLARIVYTHVYTHSVYALPATPSISSCPGKLRGVLPLSKNFDSLSLDGRGQVRVDMVRFADIMRKKAQGKIPKDALYQIILEFLRGADHVHHLHLPGQHPPRHSP